MSLHDPARACIAAQPTRPFALPPRRSGAGRKPTPIDNPPRCRNCGAVIARRRYGYSYEPPVDYLRRVFCDVRCSVAWSDRAAVARPPRPSRPRRPVSANRIRQAAKARMAAIRKRRAFDACVLAHVLSRTPRGVDAIHDAVTNDWGTVSKRSTYRAVARHRRAGRIVQTGEGYVLAARRRA